MEHPDPTQRDDDEGNELGYRNVDEEEAYDEHGSQGEGAGEPTERDADEELG